MFDVDGNSYIDYVCSWGPLLLGHRPKPVIEALQQVLEVGTSFGAPTEREIVPDPPGVGSLLLHATNRGFTVRVQYLAPSTVPPRTDRLRALLRDPRLTA